MAHMEMANMVHRLKKVMAGNLWTLLLFVIGMVFCAVVGDDEVFLRILIFLGIATIVNLTLFAVVAFVYAVLRLVEAETSDWDGRVSTSHSKEVS